MLNPSAPLTHEIKKTQMMSMKGRDMHQNGCFQHHSCALAEASILSNHRASQYRAHLLLVCKHGTLELPGGASQSAALNMGPKPWLPGKNLPLYVADIGHEFDPYFGCDRMASPGIPTEKS